jgi:hypothetical protein
MPEKGERDVQVAARHRLDPAQVLALPELDGVQDGFGQPQAEEEAKPFIALDASA